MLANKESTVPTAIAFLGFIAVAIFCFIVIKDHVDANKQSSREEEIKEVGELPDMRVSVAGHGYVVKSESSKVVAEFLERLPLDVELNDKDGNRKVGLTYYKYQSEPVKIKKAIAGDVLLEGNSTIIIVTKSFKTGDKYTKLGHIEDLGELPSGIVKVRIDKAQ